MLYGFIFKSEFGDGAKIRTWGKVTFFLRPKNGGKNGTFYYFLFRQRKGYSC